jgi:hypothetical protein
MGRFFSKQPAFPFFKFNVLKISLAISTLTANTDYGDEFYNSYAGLDR